VLAASVFVAHAQIPVRNHIPAMTDRIDWDRLARYASGEADDVERADVDRWAAENSGNRAALESVRRQLADGYVLLCVARPLVDCSFDVGVESHDRLYRNPFASPLAPHELKPGIATPLEDAR
jgi:hypothetical protein